MDVEHERQKRLLLAQAHDLKNQLHEAWEALAYYSGMDYNEAIVKYKEMKDGRKDS